MVNQLFVFAALLMLCGCATQSKRDYSNHKLEVVSKTVLDEEILVHKTIPHKLVLLNDTVFVCIANQNVLATYNIESGKLLSKIDIDSALGASGSEQIIDTFTKYFLAPYYQDRKYINRSDYSKNAPRSEWIQVLNAKVVANESLVYIVGYVSNQYKSQFEYEGKVTNAKFLAKSLVIIKMDLFTGAIYSTIPVHEYKLNAPLTKDNEMLYVQPEPGCWVNTNRELLVSAAPVYKFLPLSHFLKFPLEGKLDTFYSSKLHLPEGLKHELAVWKPQFNFHTYDNQTYFNGFFSIYKIDGENEIEVFDIREEMNLDSLERIQNFLRIDDKNYLLEIVGRNLVDQTYTGRLQWYSVKNKKLSEPIMRFVPKNFSNCFFKIKENIYYLTKDDENIYIEKTKIVSR